MSRFEKIVRGLFEAEEPKKKKEDEKPEPKPVKDAEPKKAKTLDVDDDKSKGELDTPPKDDKKKDDKKTPDKKKGATIPGQKADSNPKGGTVPKKAADNMRGFSMDPDNETDNDNANDTPTDGAKPTEPKVENPLVPINQLPDLIREYKPFSGKGPKWMNVGENQWYKQGRFPNRERIKTVADQFYQAQFGVDGDKVDMATDYDAAGPSKTPTEVLDIFKEAIKKNGKHIKDKDMDVMTMQALGINPETYKVVKVEVWDAYGHLWCWIKEEHGGDDNPLSVNFIYLAQGEGKYAGHVKLGNDEPKKLTQESYGHMIGSSYYNAAMLLLERNISNEDQIKSDVINVLKARVAQDTKENPTNELNIKKWLDSNLRNWFINGYGIQGSDPKWEEHQRLVRRILVVNGRIDIPGGIPTWLYDRMDKAIKAKPPQAVDYADWLNQNEVFYIQVSDEFIEELSHVIDFLNAEGTEYFARTRKHQVLTSRQVPETLGHAQSWGRSQGAQSDELDVMASNDAENDLGPPHKIKLLMPKFPDKWFWIQFLHATDNEYPRLAAAIPKGYESKWRLNSYNPLLRRESKLMKHCIGAGTEYGEMLRKETAEFYSLRDPNNVPKVTVEMRGKKIGQIQGFEDKTPAPSMFGKIGAFLNFLKAYEDRSNATHHHVQNCGLIFSDKGFVSRDEIAKMSGAELAALNLPREVLRRMQLVQIGPNKVVRLEDCGDRSKVSIQELELAAERGDLTDAELDKLGLIKTAGKKLKSWEQMGGETIDQNIKFDGLAMAINFPTNITFTKNVTFNGYPGKSIPAWNIAGNLTIQGGGITAISPGIRVGGALKINDCLSLTTFDGISCKSLTIGNTPDLGRISNVSVSENTEFTGSAVKEIGKGCSFAGPFVAKKSNLAGISSDAVFGSHVYLEECPITEIRIASWPGSLLLTKSSLEKLPDNMKVGFEENSPDELQVEGNQLCIDGTKLKTLPKNLKVKGTLILPKSITVLPDGLEAGTVVFSYGKIKKIPADCNVNIWVALHQKTGTPEFIYNKEYITKLHAEQTKAGKRLKRADYIVSPGDDMPTIKGF
jgi:hypothetical protein